MLPASSVNNKLDLSRLTDDEAKHVLEVIQRDFDLRKKEENRLGELKTRIEMEGTRIQLLAAQSDLTASRCIRCLQPFKFLLNSKRQCLDCQLYTCKGCSRYNKRDRGWVCDSCRAARVLKIGTLDWYHENVRSRFKHFGSAKVMRSLYKRLDEEHASPPHLKGISDGHAEDGLDSQRTKLGQNSKRLLPVHPPDFDLDKQTSPQSLFTPSQILEHQGVKAKDFEVTTNARKSLETPTRSDEGGHQLQKATGKFSLSKISNSSVPGDLTGNEMSTSDEESFARARYKLGARRHSRAVLQSTAGSASPPLTELNKRMSDLESLLNHLENKMTEPPQETEAQTEPPTLIQLEEENLRRRLGELRSVNDRGLSSEDEEVRRPLARRRSMMVHVNTPPFQKPPNTCGNEGPTDEQKRSMAAALCDITAEFLRTINATEKALAQFSTQNPKVSNLSTGIDTTKSHEALRNLEENVYISAGKSYDLEKNLQDLEQTARSRYCCNTDSELTELEDKVAKAAIGVQTAESEVSEIENKIAALSIGMSVDRTKRKAPIAAQRRRLSLDCISTRKNGFGFS